MIFVARTRGFLLTEKKFDSYPTFKWRHIKALHPVNLVNHVRFLFKILSTQDRADGTAVTMGDL
jgi:hypothetical protein